MMVSVLIVGVVFFYLNKDKPVFPETEGLEVMMVLPAFLLMVALSVTPLFVKKSLKNPNANSSTLNDKMNTYLVIHMSRVSFFEMAGIASGVISFITESTINLLIIAVVLFILFTLRPTTFRIANELNLSKEEEEQLKALDQEN